MAANQKESEAGEGYFASISDLMVGILFIFLLMLTVFAISYADEDKDKKIRELEDRVKILRGGIEDVGGKIDDIHFALVGEQGRLLGLRRTLLVDLKEALAKRNVAVDIDPSQGVLRLSSEGLFVLNEAEFTAPTGRQNAVALLEEMTARLPCYANDGLTPTSAANCQKKQPIFETILVEGHTDTVPTSRMGGNWRLSTDRARAFFDLMVDKNSILRDIRNPSNQSLIGLAGYAETRPRSGLPGNDPGNRRIEVRFLLAGQQDGDAGRKLEALRETREELSRILDRTK